jgi:hypothetical protein
MPQLPTPQPRRRRACSRRKPPRLPADTAGKRAADAYLSIGEAFGGWPHDAALAALLVRARFLPHRRALAAELTAFALGSADCLANFWRCREPHCVITGAGWAALAAFTGAELRLGRSLIHRSEPLIFLGILAAGYGFQASCRARTGSDALRRPAPTDARSQARDPR